MTEARGVHGRGTRGLRLTAAAMAFLTVVPACRREGSSRPEVVVYTSVDQPRSAPVLRNFERQTGIRVLAVHDVEATKTTGLATRLLAEAPHPEADLFWSSEPLQTTWLASHGVLAPYDAPTARDVPVTFRDPHRRWTGLGVRLRVILVNTNLVPSGREPRTLGELIRGPLAPRSGIALPLFGTSFTQAAVLFSRWGAAHAEALYRDGVAAGVRLLDGNARVASMVAAGTLAAGLTDTDDAHAVAARGAPVRIVTPVRIDDGGLAIPGTVALVAGGPHPEAARRLADWLLSAPTEKWLVREGCFERSVRDALPALSPDWSAVAPGVDVVRARLEEILLR